MRRLLSFFIFISFFHAIKNSAYTQEIIPISFKDTLSEKSAIPLSYITPKSVKVLADLKNTQEKIKKTDDIELLKAHCVVLDSLMDTYLERFESVNFSEQKSRILYNHEQELVYWIDEITSVQADIVDIVDDLEFEYNELYKLGNRWLVTLESAQSLNVEGVVVNQIVGVIKEIKLTQKQIRKAQTRFISIDGETAYKKLSLQSKINALNRNRSGVWGRWDYEMRTLPQVSWEWFAFLRAKQDDFKNDISYLTYVFNHLTIVQIIKVVSIFCLTYLLIVLAQKNIRYFPYWGEEMKTGGSLRYIFQNKLIFAFFFMLIFSFRLISSLSYTHLLFINFFVLFIISQVYVGLTFQRFRGSWGWLYVLLFMNYYISNILLK